MSIKLKGSSDGSVSFDAPADTSPSGSDITLTLPTSAGSANQFLKNSGIAGELEYSSMVETSTGIGIGTSSPSYKLHVTNDDSAAARIGGASYYLELGQYGTGSSPAISYNGSGASLAIRNGTSEAARFDSSGRLLVGLSSARANTFNSSVSQRFQIEGTDDTGRGAAIFSSASSGGAPAYLILGHQRSGSVGGNTSVSSGDELGLISFQGSDGTQFVDGARITAAADGTTGANDMPTRLTFSTCADGASSPTERMRITSGGDLFTIHGDNGVVSRSTLSAGTSNTVFIGQHSASSITAGTNSCKIYTNGNIQNTNNSYGSLSDVKLKENIVDASSQWDDIKDIRVRNYNFIEGQTHTQIGVVAQEVETVSPGLVYDTPDRDDEGNDLGTVTKSVNYSVLYMKAVKALQEAQTRIETLESQHADLLARVTALEAA